MIFDFLRRSLINPVRRPLLVWSAAWLLLSGASAAQGQTPAPVANPSPTEVQAPVISEAGSTVFKPDLRVAPGARTQDLRAVGRWWIAPAGLAPEAALAHALKRPLPLPPPSSLILPPGESLYGRIGLQFVPPELPTEWRLALPLPTLDLARLHYRDWWAMPGQRWALSQTGDRLAMAHTPQSHLSPVLAFHTADTDLELIIELHHPSGALSAPVRLTPVDTVIAHRTQRAIVAGALLGLAGLMFLICFVETLRSRGTEPFFFTLFTLLVTASVAVHTGVASIYVFPNWTDGAHWARFVVPLFLMGSWVQANVWLLGFDQHSKAIWRLTLLWSVAMMVLGVAMPWIGDGTAIRVLTVMQLLSVLFVSLVAALALYLRREGAKTALTALALITVGSGLTSLELLGVIHLGAIAWDAFPIGVVLGCASLFIAVIGRQRDRLQAAGRSDALASHDPLTGLPNEAALRYTFARVMHRMAFYRHRALVMMIEIENLDEIGSETGVSAPAEMLVRLSATLRDTLRQFDLLVKLEDNRFVALVEGPMTVAKARELATRMLAAALRMHVRGIRPQLRLALTDAGGEGAQLTACLKICRELLAAQVRPSTGLGGSGNRAIRVQFSQAMTEAVSSSATRPSPLMRKPENP